MMNATKHMFIKSIRECREYVIVTNARTDEAFGTGKEEAIQLRSE